MHVESTVCGEGETGKLKIKQFELMTFDDLTVN